MKCPNCHEKANVIKVVHRENGDIIRCQKCRHCGMILYTEEVYDAKKQLPLKSELNQISYKNLEKAILKRNGVKTDD
jgi:transcriptional regulator NrdR family protein